MLFRSDGRMEVSRRIDGQTIQIGQTAQGIFYSSPLAAQAFPVPFAFLDSCSVSVMPSAGTMWPSCSSRPTLTSWPAFYPFSEIGHAGAVDITIFLVATGRWK